MRSFNKSWQHTLNLVWLVTSILLIVGLTRPMFTFTHFYFFDDTFSLVNGVFHLAQQGEFILFVLLFIFSLLMPVIKMLMLLYTINAPTIFSHVQQRRLNKLAKLGKWSMLDVYVIAILAVTLKLSMIATVSIHYGLVAFAVSVTLSMMLPWLISYAHKQRNFGYPNDNNGWDWVEMHDNQAITLDLSSLKNLLDNGCLSLDIGQGSNDLLIDIFNQEQEWQAKVKIEQQGTTTLLLLIAHC
jgi:paraquat-inducible protein A